MRIAILDDYQHVALTSADWSKLPPGHEITVFDDHIPDDDVEGLRRRLLPFDIVCIMRERTRMPIRLIEQLPNLKLIAVAGGGSSVIDIGLAAERGVMVCGTDGKGYGAEEYAFALVMALARGIVPEYEAVRKGAWQVGVGRDLYGATLSILGLGRLGPRVAGYAKAFGMNILAWSQNMTAEQAAASGATLVSKDELFARADFLTILVRLSPRTIGLVGAHEIDLMRPNAFLINVSRGPILQIPPLIKALKEKRLGGAALDVFDHEPLAADDPLRNTERLLITPHIGYVTDVQYATFHGGQCDAVDAFLRGKPIYVLGPQNEMHRG